MGPFGCSLTILNTLDSLGKFDGKSDEGYLLGYSTSSKAFRVYNKRTKRIEENMHINFLEDQPNVAGTGPNWMFDLDFLTNSMNYIPVSIKNQVNVDAGIQDSCIAGSSGKDKGPTQEYILLPLQPYRTRIPVKVVVQIAQEKPSENASSDKDVHDSEDDADKEEQHQMQDNEKYFQDELEMLVTHQMNPITHLSYEAPLPEGNTSGSTEDIMQLKELIDIIPRLVTRIETLETELQKTKTTYGKAVLTLVKKVKILENALKRKTHKVVISNSEGEEPEDQRRIIQDIDDDPLVSLVRESMQMNEKSTDFVTPTKASGEAQEEDISPTILEAAKILSKVASQGVSKVKSIDQGKRYRRRARLMAKIINTGLDVEEEINTSIEEVNTGSAKVDSGTASKRGHREGKASMVKEDIQATHKTKE
ncbi:retrovirus-related pol polyprotein from transposon TNT 1-94 [Tanacetum coccineum]